MVRKASSSGGGRRARNRVIARGMSGERSKNSPEKRNAVWPHEPQVATSNLACAWLRSGSRADSFCRRGVVKFVFVRIARFDDYGSASSLTIAGEKIGEASLSVAYAMNSLATM